MSLVNQIKDILVPVTGAFVAEAILKKSAIKMGISMFEMNSSHIEEITKHVLEVVKGLYGDKTADTIEQKLKGIK